jgi:hypothetical protein
MINNLSKEEYHFNKYYGYLIGENISFMAIEDNDSSFVDAHSLGYIFKPYYRVPGRFWRPDGSLYTEVISFSSLLKRAKELNRAFL